MSIKSKGDQDRQLSETRDITWHVKTQKLGSRWCLVREWKLNRRALSVVVYAFRVSRLSKPYLIHVQNASLYAGSLQLLVMNAGTWPKEAHVVYESSAVVPIAGQSCSVMLVQKTHTITTARRVKSVWNNDPSILPLVPEQMWMLMRNSKICPIANRMTAEKRKT